MFLFDFQIMDNVLQFKSVILTIKYEGERSIKYVYDIYDKYVLISLLVINRWAHPPYGRCVFYLLEKVVSDILSVLSYCDNLKTV